MENTLDANYYEAIRNIEFGGNTIESIEQKSLKDTLNKTTDTIRLVWQLLDDAATVLIVDGRIRKLTFVNVLAWWKLAKIAYGFISKVYEIWKK